MQLARHFASFALCAAAALGQPTSDLLQSAIFAQEARGDLDTAIRIYQQILAGGPSMRLYAAQAQYRLGVCELRKKDAAAAKAAFAALARDFPDERELIARSRELLASTLHRLKRYSEAEDAFARAAAILEGSPQSTQLADVLHNQAMLYRDTRRLAGASVVRARDCDL